MYNRYNEIKIKINNSLNKKTSSREKIINAVKELVYLREEEMPEFSIDIIKTIKSDLTRKPEKNGKSSLMTTIDSMNETQIQKYLQLLRTI